MSSSVLHRCPSCGHEADVSGSLEEFSKDPHCRQCGLSDSEGSLKMQDDLAALFMRQMSMEGVHQTGMTLPPTPSTFKPVQAVQPLVYSITQHYHHSSHLATSTSLPSQQSSGPEPKIWLGVSAESTLMQHNIDPSSLFPSQLTLFKQAGPDQQSRLITLWQISPPGYGKQASQGPGNFGTFNDQGKTSSYSEGNGIAAIGGDSMEEDGPGEFDHQQAEPYVISGYESLAQRDYAMSARQGEMRMSFDQQVLAQSTPPVEPSTGSRYKLANDPAYQSQEWWNHSCQRYPVEHQYGDFQQMNQ